MVQRCEYSSRACTKTKNAAALISRLYVGKSNNFQIKYLVAGEERVWGTHIKSKKTLTTIEKCQK